MKANIPAGKAFANKNGGMVNLKGHNRKKNILFGCANNINAGLSGQSSGCAIWFNAGLGLLTQLGSKFFYFFFYF